MAQREKALTLPHSPEAEQSVLGALLLTSSAIDAIPELEPKHFYFTEHERLFRLMQSHIAAGKTVDVVTMAAAGAGELSWLVELAQSMPSAANITRYAEIIRERWAAREVAGIGRELVDGIMADHPQDVPVNERVDKAMTRLLGVVSGDDRAEPQSMAGVTVGFLDVLQARFDGTDCGISTGFRDLDELTCGGGRPGELWVIGARPSMGKTAFTMTLSRNVANQQGVLFCSQEDSKDSCASRNIAALGRIGLSHLRRPDPRTVPHDFWDRVSEAADRLASLHLEIDDQGSLTLMDVKRKVRQVSRRMKVSAVVIDYLQLMAGDGSTRNLQLGTLANGLKAAAKELGVWIILLSQLSREADKRPGPPQMSDLRDSGDIEGAADFIGLLYRECMRNPTDENKNYAAMNVAKQKNGPTGMVSFKFEGAYQQFSDWDGPVPRAKLGRSGAGAGGFD